MTSTRPYLLRAFYEWILDNEMTPYIIIDAEMPAVHVPRQYVEDGKIVLNISPYATDDLKMGNQTITFEASFSGVVDFVSAPIRAVIAIYARENGRGMVFNEDDEDDRGDMGELSNDVSTPEALFDENSDDNKPTKPTSPSSGKKSGGNRPKLRIVK